MKNLMTTKILLATAIIAGSAAATAQTNSSAGTSTMPGMSANQPTTGVGVTPQAAAEANRQAVPRNDTGTVVRTAPNAADSARNATGMSSSPMGDTNTGTTMRSARADRN